MHIYLHLTLHSAHWIDWEMIMLVSISPYPPTLSHPIFHHRSMPNHGCSVPSSRWTSKFKFGTSNHYSLIHPMKCVQKNFSSKSRIQSGHGWMMDPTFTTLSPIRFVFCCHSESLLTFHRMIKSTSLTQSLLPPPSPFILTNGMQYQSAIEKHSTAQSPNHLSP